MSDKWWTTKLKGVLFFSGWVALALSSLLLFASPVAAVFTTEDAINLLFGMSFDRAGTVSGPGGTIEFTHNDLLAYHVGSDTWTRLLEAAAYEVPATCNVDAVMVYDDWLVYSCAARVWHAALERMIEPEDLVATGLDSRLSFMLLDGSDVGLDAPSGSENIVSVLDGDNNRLGIVTEGAFEIPAQYGGAAGSGGELLLFEPVSWEYQPPSGQTDGVWRIQWDPVEGDSGVRVEGASYSCAGESFVALEGVPSGAGIFRAGVGETPSLDLIVPDGALPDGVEPDALMVESATCGETADLQLVMMEAAAADGVVCNDGSPAGFYYRPSPYALTNQWVVYLRAGGGCYDSESCARRGLGEGPLTSSDYWPPTEQIDGILSPSPVDNPAFYSFHHILVPYCSSDYWTGDREASAETNGWHFKGKAILTAVLEELHDGYAELPPMVEAELVLLVGASAGGEGVLQNVDAVANQLAPVPVMGIDDAAFALAFEPYDERLVPVAETARIGFDYLGAHVDQSCAAALGEEAWRCFLGPTVYPFIESPLFIQIDQRDSYMMGCLGITDLNDPDQALYVAQYRQALLIALAEVEALFSPNQNRHVLLNGDGFVSSTIHGIPYRDAVQSWLFDGENLVLIAE